MKYGKREDVSEGERTKRGKGATAARVVYMSAPSVADLEAIIQLRHHLSYLGGGRETNVRGNHPIRAGKC